MLGALLFVAGACATTPPPVITGENSGAAPTIAELVQPLPVPPSGTGDIVAPPVTAPEIDRPALSPEPPPKLIVCQGPAMQGGVILCATEPHAELTLDDVPVAVADAAGIAVIGLSRKQPSPATIRFRTSLEAPVAYSRRIAAASVDIIERQDVVSAFKMDCSKIAAQTPAQKRHAEVSWVKKDAALKRFNPALAPVAFVKPAEGPYSSPFGAVRTYLPTSDDCEPSTSVHNGLDIAVPTGSAIRAPMAGTVILADPDLYYEGGCVFLDHGRGLVSVFMHLSEIGVAAGDVIRQGELLGRSGATGRVTGPHLHWAIKYRNVTSPDRGTDTWLDPSLVLQLDSATLAP